MSKNITRREFLRKGALATLGLSALAGIVGATSFNRLRIPASDKLRVAHIGLGGMGNQHMKWFAELADVDIVALCDVDPDHLHSTMQKLNEVMPDTKSQVYT